MSSLAPAVDPSEAVIDLAVTAAPILSDEVIRLARAAAVDESGGDAAVGDYLGAVAEDDIAVSAAFAAADRGYRGWYWSVTLAIVDPAAPTVSEVVLLPGAQALLAPPWVPWDQRIRAGDVGVGDLLATPADDPRLVPGYLDSDDPAVAEVAYEFGFGRVRVLGREGREDAAQRWHDGKFGPDDAVAQQAPASCASCGFFVPLAGLLGMAMGACANEFSPADGRVVDVEYGCGAHSETVIEAPMISASTDTVVDEFTLEVHQRPVANPVDDVTVTVAHRSAVDDAAEVALDGVALDEVSPAEVALDEVSPAEVALDEVSLEEVALDEVSLEEVALDEVSPEEVALDVVAIDEVALDEVAAEGPVDVMPAWTDSTPAASDNPEFTP